VAASLSVAVVLAILYVAYDVALSRGATCLRRPANPGDRRLHRPRPVIGSVVTYLIVPQPTGSGSVTQRNAGAPLVFAAVPIAYLVMVVAVQIVRPILG
jgi:hypothetical protein